MAGADKLAGLAQTYAEALLEVAEERGCADEVLEQLEAIVAYGERHPEFRKAFLSLLASPAQRAGAVERLFRGRANDVLLDFYQVLNRKGRPDLLPEIAVAFRKALQRVRGLIEAEVTTAAPLTDADRERLRAAVTRRSGRTALLVERVDPALLGGIVLRVADVKYDTTLKNQLARLHASLLERASNEIIQSRSPAPEVK